MDEVEKQLRNMLMKDRGRVLDAMTCIIHRDFEVLDRKQLRGSKHFFRVRVGQYRIVYIDNNEEIVFISVGRRNETTYNNF